MTIKARFWNGAGIMFETPNKDFTMHLGGWAQWDNVWWNQSASLQGVPNAQNQSPAGGFGTLEDGDYWRRIRLVMEGNFWQTFEYRWNFALENSAFNSVNVDEFWVGVNKVPLIGTIRAGHVKNAMGLEGDMVSSSRCMTFMERSSYSEAIELNQNFVSGLWFGNTFLTDDRATWSAVVFRTDNANSGDFFGTGQWGMQGRVTALPFYEDEGRHLLHVGLSGGWRSGTAGKPGSPNDNVDLRARPELRDDAPAGDGYPASGTTAATGGFAPANYYLPDANSNRLIDTGKITCIDDMLLGLEFCTSAMRFRCKPNTAGTPSTPSHGTPLHLQWRVRPGGLHAHGRDPGLRQAERLFVPLLLRRPGSV